MSKRFLWLPGNFLFRRINGYEFPDESEYTDVDEAILLRDCEYDKSLKKGFENEDFFRRSLFLGEL